MPDFSKARVGDKAWHIALGECIVMVVDGKSVRLENDYGKTRWVYFDGKSECDDYAPVAFHSQPEWTDPPPPKRMRKVVVERRIHVHWDGKEAVTYTVRTDQGCPWPKGCVNEFNVSSEFEVEEKP